MKSVKVPAFLKNPATIGWLVVGGVALYAFWRFRKATSTPDQGEVAAREAGTLAASGLRASYPDSAYAGFADRIYTAGTSGFGTDEASIYEVFGRMNNDLDVAKLVAAFGNRRGEFTIQFAGLGGWLRTELSAAEIAKVNSILAAKGLRYRF